MSNYVRGCKAMQLAQAAYDNKMSDDQDDALQLEIERVASELYLEGESCCCGQALTFEQAVLMAMEDGDLLYQLSKMCLDDTEIGNAVSSAGQIENAIERMVRAAVQEAQE